MAASRRNLLPNKPTQKKFIITTVRSPGQGSPAWVNELPDDITGGQVVSCLSLPSAILPEPAHCHGHKVVPGAPSTSGRSRREHGIVLEARKPLLSHLIGQDRVTCLPLNQSLETRLTVIGLKYSGSGLFPEPVGGHQRPGALSYQEEEEQEAEEMWDCHPLLPQPLSLLPGCLPQFPS